jgi:hypothetical protein
MPAAAREWMRNFPRNVWWARILTALGLAWAAYLLFHTSLGPVEKFKPLLWVLTPISFVLIILYVDELLAPRALGGLLLLAATPVLDAARWHPADLRLVMTVVAYVWIIKGMILVMTPYRFRTTTERWLRTDTGCRICGAAEFIFGFVILFLGLKVY